MSKFVLTVLDPDHLILTTEEQGRPDEMQAILGSFERWKQNGGLLIITDCLAIDRYGMEVDLDVDGQKARDKLILKGVPSLVPPAQRFLGDPPR